MIVFDISFSFFHHLKYTKQKGLKYMMCNLEEAYPQHQPTVNDEHDEMNMNPTIEPQPKMDAVLINMDGDKQNKHVENSMFCQCKKEQCVKRRKIRPAYYSFAETIFCFIFFCIGIFVIVWFHQFSFVIIAAVSSSATLGWIAINRETLRDIQRQICTKVKALDQIDEKAKDEEIKGFWDANLDKKVIF